MKVTLYRLCPVQSVTQVTKTFVIYGKNFDYYVRDRPLGILQRRRATDNACVNRLLWLPCRKGLEGHQKIVKSDEISTAMTIDSHSRSWDPEGEARDGEKSDAGYKMVQKAHVL